MAEDSLSITAHRQLVTAGVFSTLTAPGDRAQAEFLQKY